MNLNEVIGQEIMEELGRKGYDKQGFILNHGNVLEIGRALYNVMFELKTLTGVDTAGHKVVDHNKSIVVKQLENSTSKKRNRNGILPQPEWELKNEIFEALYSSFGNNIEGKPISKLVKVTVKLNNAYYIRKMWPNQISLLTDYRAWIKREKYNKCI